MFDWVNCVIFFLLMIPATLYADRVCHLELKYLEDFGDKKSFYPRYVNRHPIIAFALIALFNFFPIFLIYSVASFVIFLVVQVFICLLGFTTLQLQKATPKVFDYIAVFISFIDVVVLLLMALR